MTETAATDRAATGVPRHPTLAEATAVWARIGLLSFGGPAGQIALMHRELVDERRWISDARFLHALNFCMLLPGPEAQQLATYIGWLLHGMRGGLIAGTLFVLPGFVVIVALSTAYALFQDTAWLASLFFGLKAAVLAVVVQALFRIGKRALRTPTMVGIAALAFVAIYAFSVPFPVVVLAAGLIGFVGVRIRPDQFPVGGHGGGKADVPDGVVDRKDAAGDPSIARAVRLLAAWGALWAAPVVVLALAFGPDTVFVRSPRSFRRWRLLPSAAPMPCSPTSPSKRWKLTAGCSPARCWTGSPWPRRRRDRSSWC
jgi:chromate transporter